MKCISIDRRCVHEARALVDGDSALKSRLLFVSYQELAKFVVSRSSVLTFLGTLIDGMSLETVAIQTRSELPLMAGHVVKPTNLSLPR
jgi:hypothetical protein